MNCPKPPHSHSSLPEAWIPSHWLGLGSCACTWISPQGHHVGWTGAARWVLPLGRDGAMATLENATPGDYSHQECSGSCRDEGYSSVMERKAKVSGWSMQRLNFQRHNRGPSTPTLLWGIAIGPVSLVFERNGQAMGLDKSQSLEMSLCSPITFEFLPCYKRSSLFAQAELNISFPIVGGAQGKVFGALIFGPFPKPFSLHPSQQPLPVSCQSQEKTSELLPVCKTSAFTIWHSVVMGVTGDLIGLTRLIIFDTLCVRLGTPPLTHSHTLYSVLWLVSCQLYFPKARETGLTVLGLTVSFSASASWSLLLTLSAS